jgi:hypothetical protein
MTTSGPQIRYKRPWDRATQKKKELRKKRADRAPMIYFFRCGDFVKIGWTTDPEARFACVQVCNPSIISLAALMLGGGREEIFLHRAFKEVLHRGEWFREEGHLAELIKLICDAEPVEARAIAGDWLLEKFGKMDLLIAARFAQKPEPGTADFHQSAQ